MFRVQQIDHVELIVPDQYEAAAWYKKVFGLEVIPEFEFWASSGPLMLTTPEAGTKLALFKGSPPKEVSGFVTLAFRVDADGFVQFRDRVKELGLSNHRGIKLTPDNTVVDHQLSWSIYFRDPWGYPYEITTYEYDAVKSKLGV
jgi:catechol 2,3-dioxygenase-like lactoylglutathione lyase family enzyme